MKMQLLKSQVSVEFLCYIYLIGYLFDLDQSDEFVNKVYGIFNDVKDSFMGKNC